jgi:DNA repair exonuclease SbcCD ATPase subunit
MKKYLTPLSVLAVALFLQGCLVTKSRYDAKVAESEVLRSALSECKKKNSTLSNQIEEFMRKISSLENDLSGMKKELEIKEGDNQRLKKLIDELKKTYDATKISREKLVNKLLEKEKKYSSTIKELTLVNTRLEDEINRLKDELAAVQDKNRELSEELSNMSSSTEKMKEDYRRKVEEVQKLNIEIEGLTSKIHLLEGKISRLKDEIGEFLPIASLRQKSSSALSDTISSSFISKEISYLVASVPLEIALKAGKSELSKDFSSFLEKLAGLCRDEGDCRLDVIATGVTYTAEMDILVDLKNRELSFLKALKKFMSKNRGSASVIRKKGRVTMIDKMGEKIKSSVKIKIYIVRERKGE